jgi:hypothetical protein
MKYKPTFEPEIGSNLFGFDGWRRSLLSFVVKGWKSSYLTSGRLKNVLCPTNKVDFFTITKTS